MIKIQSSSYPVVWQVDTSYNLPNCTGQVRWNGTTKCFEVCDNNNSSYNGGWMRIENTVQLNSDPQIQSVLEWAKKKMEEDKRIEQLVKKYPAVKDAKEKLEIIIKLVQDENSST
jgi:hypothetical protein